MTRNTRDETPAHTKNCFRNPKSKSQIKAEILDSHDGKWGKVDTPKRRIFMSHNVDYV
jgi:hypothetical protein